ncbi:MAG: Txe/YoeB family addiction module toxin [Bacteroidia bacterium]|nr:Txe/YoeB family addiction module toxin [Bacteroidia bacterium]
MKYRIKFSGKAEDDIERLRKSGDLKALKKLAQFYIELESHPRTGTGQVEQMKHYANETWSRRITRKHRLVYEIEDNTVTVTVISAYGHYDDK